MYFSSASSRLLLYEASSWDLKKSYGCYDGVLRDISWSDDSKYILQVNSKGVVEILSPADHDVRSLQHIPLKDTWAASFHRDGHRNIAIGTKSGNVMIWDTKNKSVIKTFPTPSQQSCVDYISYNAKNTAVAAAMHNGETVIYGQVSNIPVLSVKLPCSRSISAMKFHHESRSLLGLATDEGHVILRDITSNKDKGFFENVHASPVSDIAFSLINRDVMLSSGYDKIIHVYDIRMQNVVSTIRTAYTLTSLAINPENQVALGTKNGLVLIYDLKDLSNPFKVLKGHEEEVRRVAFQPVRKKMFSTETSLREDTEINFTTDNLKSPVRKRNSDMFFIVESPPKNNFEETQGDSKADSFLVMMGLDKSQNDFDDDVNKSVDYEKCERRMDEMRYRELDAEKNISKISTPINRTAENLIFPSPLLANGIPESSRGSNIDILNIKQSIPNLNSVTNMDSKTMEDLKGFIKLTLADVADDNRNHFLHIMMAFTKQKLYLEKQMSGLSEQVENLIHNQNALVETNRKLALEIDLLKARQNIS